MKSYEIIGTNGIRVQGNDGARYQNVVAFDECFNIVDVYVMLKAYFGKKGVISEFTVKDLGSGEQ